MVKSLPANAGDIRDTVSILGSGSSPGRGHGNPLQYSRLENPHGWRSLVGYGVWGLKELHKPEHTQVRIRNSRQGRRQAEGSWWHRGPPPVSSPAFPLGRCWPPSLICVCPTFLSPSLRLAAPLLGDRGNGARDRGGGEPPDWGGDEFQGKTHSARVLQEPTSCGAAWAPLLPSSRPHPLGSQAGTAGASRGGAAEQL